MNAIKAYLNLTRQPMPDEALHPLLRKIEDTTTYLQEARNNPAAAAMELVSNYTLEMTN